MVERPLFSSPSPPLHLQNSYNPAHPGTVINEERTHDNLVTAITCKRDVQLIDITSTRMLGAYGFLSKVFDTFEKHKLSVDVLASSEVSVSLTLDKKSSVFKGHPLCLDLEDIAKVDVKEGKVRGGLERSEAAPTPLSKKLYN